MKKLWSRRPDDRGAVLVMAVVGIVVSLMAAALAIDIGRLAHDKRFDQKVADLAAIDAARAINDPSRNALDRARDSLSPERNDFSYTTSGWGMTEWDVNVCRGAWTPAVGPLSGTFVPNSPLDCAAGPIVPLVPPLVEAVRVHVRSPFKAIFPFVGGSDGTSATGIATQAGIVTPLPPSTTTTTSAVPPPPSTPVAGFSLGSSLATVDSTRSALLNAVVGGMLEGNLNLEVASWQGLIDSDVTLLELQTALVARNYMTIGTPSQLLAEEFTLAELFQATADALDNKGLLVGATLAAFNGALGLIAQANNSTTVQLRDLLEVASGSEGAAMSAAFNVFQLVNGSAAVANGTNFVDVNVPNASLPSIAGLPSAVSTNFRLQVIEAPIAYYGPDGPTPPLRTAQVSLTVTPTINIVVPGVATVTGNIPIAADGGEATGQLAIQCSTPGITVSVTTEAAGATASSTLNARLVGIIPVNLPLPVQITTSAGGGTFSNLPFAYEGDFGPPGTHVGGTTLNPSVSLSVLGINVTAVLGVLNPLVDSIDDLIIQPLLQSLGLDLGAADVTAMGPLQGCEPPAVSTTTTVPAVTTTTIPPSTTVPQPKLVQ